MGSYQSQEPENSNQSEAQPKIFRVEDPAQQHTIKQENADGSLVCNCGFIPRNRHIYNLHVEHSVGIRGDLDPSGWPTLQFQTGMKTVHIISYPL
jgi:hypothetical protein